MAMTQTQILNNLETLKTAIANDEVGMEDVMEFLEDIICDINGDDCFTSFDSLDDDMYQSFEETDFTKLEVI
jgi:hypothetical protein